MNPEGCGEWSQKYQSREGLGTFGGLILLRVNKYLTTGTGLEITDGQAPVTLSDQTCFCSDMTRFWPVKFE